MKPYNDLIHDYTSPHADPPMIVAISKKQPNDQLIKAYEFGYRHFGESTLAGLERTIGLLSENPDAFCHFVGPIQSRKLTKLCVTNVWMIHSIAKSDHLEICLRLQQQNRDIPKLLLQVNSAENPHQQGFPLDVEYLSSLITHYSSLPICGGMVIGPNPNRFTSSTQWESETRRVFNATVAAFKELTQAHPPFIWYSLGMSQDAHWAITAGANCLRLGTRLFGSRS